MSRCSSILVILITTCLIDTLLQAGEVHQEFLSSGVTRRMGGYRPYRAEMDKDAEIVKEAPEGLVSPKYGIIEVGEKSWAFIIDEAEDQPAKLYIDTNNDKDLTNDPETKWEARTQGETTSYSG